MIKMNTTGIETPGKTVGPVISKKGRIKSLLYFSSFLSYGLGDGITAAYMMEKTGASIEANPLAQIS